MNTDSPLSNPGASSVGVASGASRDGALTTGRYRLEGVIGRGGMGEIIKAHDESLRRLIAMKVLLNTTDETQRRRFVQEAQITGQLEHPCVVPVHEMGIDATGRPYFTMKLVNGSSLSEIFKQLKQRDAETESTYPLIKLIKILIDVSNAIAFAHHRGVVHRDVKPANIMVGQFGEVLVLDWGLAKVVAGQPPITERRTKRTDSNQLSSAATQVRGNDSESNPVSSSLNEDAFTTRSGTVAGTPAYMSPEQARGDTNRITRRSDVYALGALLYEMLTLTPPVQSTSASACIAQVIAGHIDAPQRRAPKRIIPNALAAIAMKALKTEPHQRYASVEDFRKDLEAFLDGRGVSAKTDSTVDLIVRIFRHNPIASIATIVGVFLTLTVAAIGIQVNRSARHRAEVQGTLALAARAQAESALQQTIAEHVARSHAQQAACQALIFEARFHLDSGEIDVALNALESSLELDPSNSEAHWLRAVVLVAKRDVVRAAQEVAICQRLRVDHADLGMLGEWCRRIADGEESASVEANVMELLRRQGTWRLAIAFATTRDQRIALYRSVLETAWPGSGKELIDERDGSLSFDAHASISTITDLRPLRGIPLTSLSLNEEAKIVDLSPLKGMPLHSLEINQCLKVADIGALAGMPLTHLSMQNCNRITDFTVLRTLRLIELDMSECRSFDDPQLLAGQPLRSLSVRGCRALGDLNAFPELPSLAYLNLGNSEISDLHPITRFPKLTHLIVTQCPVKDVGPLADLPLLSDVILPIGKEVVGLERLRGKPTLKVINVVPAEDFWKTLDARPHSQSGN